MQSKTVVTAALVGLFAGPSFAARFDNPFYPANGKMDFNWKIFSFSGDTGWVSSDEVQTSDSYVDLPDESCGCPSQDYSGCYRSVDADSVVWQYW